MNCRNRSGSRFLANSCSYIPNIGVQKKKPPINLQNCIFHFQCSFIQKICWNSTPSIPKSLCATERSLIFIIFLYYDSAGDVNSWKIFKFTEKGNIPPVLWTYHSPKSNWHWSNAQQRPHTSITLIFLYVLTST